MQYCMYCCFILLLLQYCINLLAWAEFPTFLPITTNTITTTTTIPLLVLIRVSIFERAREGDNFVIVNFVLYLLTLLLLLLLLFLVICDYY